MELGPIFRSLLRNKTGAVLIALQIMVTLTVMVNAIYIIQERAQHMARPSGLDEANITHIRSIGYGESFNAETSTDNDLRVLREMSGVEDATVINAISVSNSGSSNGYTVEPGRLELLVMAAQYRSDDHAIATMGLNLIAGENFSPNEVVRREPGTSRADTSVIVTRAMAEALYPDEPAESTIGRIFYSVDDNALQIKGIVEKLQAPWPTTDFVENSIIYPEIDLGGANYYMIRHTPGYRDENLPRIEETLAAQNYSRVLRDNQTFEQTRIITFIPDNAMTQILTIVVSILMFITGLGIVGLAVFTINRRRRQIGTRRALGAGHLQILRYFLVENFVISAAGVLLGAMMTVGLNIFLVQNFDLAPLQWYFVPVGMILLLVLGQMAVAGPAWRASRMSPATATRNV
jgi:putative ABC transport system permease protein